jgi:hypothetical protein
VTDVVFGPALVTGEWPCPDCDAAPRQLCHWWCPRYADDPGGEEVPDGDT